METMHAAGRRTLPPVPRTSTDRAAVGPGAAVVDSREAETPTERFLVDLTTGEQHAASEGPVGEVAIDDRTDVVAPAVQAAMHPAGPSVAEHDLAQQFVTRLRAAAADFAAAAGADSAVVREAVPPARHRRARCRVVLRYADGSEVDVTFVGPAGSPGQPSRHGFDRQIRRWLTAGLRPDDAWLVADPESPDGVAVDLSRWIAVA